MNRHTSWAHDENALLFFLFALLGLIFTVHPATLHAQSASPWGVQVHIVSPDSGTFARTGDSVQVNVLRFENLAPALNTVIVAMQSDTSTVVDTQNVIAPKFVDTLSVLDIFAGSGQGSADAPK